MLELGASRIDGYLSDGCREGHRDRNPAGISTPEQVHRMQRQYLPVAQVNPHVVNVMADIPVHHLHPDPAATRQACGLVAIRGQLRRGACPPAGSIATAGAGPEAGLKAEPKVVLFVHAGEELPASVIHQSGSDQSSRGAWRGRVHCYVVVRLDRSRVVQRIQQGRHQRGGRQDGEADDGGRDALADHDCPSLPDHGVERNWAWSEIIERGAKLGAEVLFVVDSHRASQFASSALPLSLARARDVWLLTFPTEQPSVAATCDSVRSSQYRSTSTSRCLRGSVPSAAITVARSPCWPAGSGTGASVSGGDSVSRSLTRRLRKRPPVRVQNDPPNVGVRVVGLAHPRPGRICVG